MTREYHIERARDEVYTTDMWGDGGVRLSDVVDRINSIYDDFESKINKLEELLQIQKDNLTDDYMIGLHNGIELPIAVLREEEPNYIDCPKKTCESCKHVRFTDEAKNDTWCTHYCLEDVNTSLDFYCAYWEAKEKR